jgi:hypothetical protein
MVKNDPVLRFEHAHGRLNELAVEMTQSLRPMTGRSSTDEWQALITRLGALRDELIHHFANEEEALFPFLRANLPAKAEVVDRLEAVHDTICGAVVRAHAAAVERHLPWLLTLHERFQSAYAGHAGEEAELIGGLGASLDERQRAELAELLRGL